MFVAVGFPLKPTFSLESLSILTTSCTKLIKYKVLCEKTLLSLSVISVYSKSNYEYTWCNPESRTKATKKKMQAEIHPGKASNGVNKVLKDQPH